MGLSGGETDFCVCVVCRQLQSTPTTIGIRTLKAAFKTLSSAQDSEAAFSKLDQKDMVFPNKVCPPSPALKNKRTRKDDNESSVPAEGEGGSELQPKTKRMTISRLVWRRTARVLSRAQASTLPRRSHRHHHPSPLSSTNPSLGRRIPSMKTFFVEVWGLVGGPG